MRHHILEQHNLTNTLIGISNDPLRSFDTLREKRILIHLKTWLIWITVSFFYFSFFRNCMAYCTKCLLKLFTLVTEGQNQPIHIKLTGDSDLGFVGHFLIHRPILCRFKLFLSDQISSWFFVIIEACSRKKRNPSLERFSIVLIGSITSQSESITKLANEKTDLER